MSFLEFLLEYYVWIITVLVILIIGIIGFIVDSIQSNKKNDVDNNNSIDEVNSTPPVKKKKLFNFKGKNSSKVDLKSLENNEPLVLEEPAKNTNELLNNASSNVNVDNTNNINNNITTNNLASSTNNNLEQVEILGNNQNEVNNVANNNPPLTVNPISNASANNEIVLGEGANKIDNSTNYVTPNNDGITTQQNSTEIVAPSFNFATPNITETPNVTSTESIGNIPKADVSIASQNNQPINQVTPIQVATTPNVQVANTQIQNQVGVVNQNVNLNNGSLNNNPGLNNPIPNQQAAQPVNQNLNMSSQPINTNTINNNIGTNLQSNVINPSQVTTTVGSQPFDISSMFANNN